MNDSPEMRNKDDTSHGTLAIMTRIDWTTSQTAAGKMYSSELIHFNNSLFRSNFKLRDPPFSLTGTIIFGWGLSPSLLICVASPNSTVFFLVFYLSRHKWYSSIQPPGVLHSRGLLHSLARVQPPWSHGASSVPEMKYDLPTDELQR